jgi:hypothetical protein
MASVSLFVMSNTGQQLLIAETGRNPTRKGGKNRQSGESFENRARNEEEG